MTHPMYACTMSTAGGGGAAAVVVAIDVIVDRLDWLG